MGLANLVNMTPELGRVYILKKSADQTYSPIGMFIGKKKFDGEWFYQFYSNADGNIAIYQGPGPIKGLVVKAEYPILVGISKREKKLTAVERDYVVNLMVKRHQIS